MTDKDIDNCFLDARCDALLKPGLQPTHAGRQAASGKCPRDGQAEMTYVGSPRVNNECWMLDAGCWSLDALKTRDSALPSVALPYVDASVGLG